MTGTRRQKLDGRRGAVFCIRLTEEQRAAVEARMETTQGPRALGPFLVWSASGITAAANGRRVLPRRRSAVVTPAQAAGNTRAAPEIPTKRRVILDLCAGSGAWSEPYKRAGYKVVRVTLPKADVRTFSAKGLRVWGVLAAPPCTEFSLARNAARKVRDFAEGMACVNAIYRLVQQTRPRWWALENPVGMLSTWLGTPRDVFDPCDFGDPWTKRTALWGEFRTPERGPYVRPATGKTRLERDAADRAVTPPGFARAFFEANP